MKAPMTLAASTLVLVTLSGCASQAQVNEQNRQLAAIHDTVQQILVQQIEANNLQKQALTQQHQDQEPQDPLVFD